MKKVRPRPLLALCAGLYVASGSLLSAQAAYRSQDRINLIIGYEIAGSYDIYARFIAPYLSRHLPGQPTITPQNMPGAGSLKATNYLYNVAAKDGLTIGMVGQGVPQMALFDQPGIQFEAEKFLWIGRVTDVRGLIAVWHTAPVKTIEDAKVHEVTIAIGGPISGSTLYVSFLNALAGTKMRGIAGYASRAAMLAMERGEIHGSSSISWSNLEWQYAHYLREKKVNVLVQVGSKRDSALPDVPLLSELASNEQDRKILEVIASSDIIGRSLVAPPGIPPANLEALRKALMDALRDPEALATAQKMKLDVNPMDGVALQRLVEETNQLPPDLVARIRSLTGSKK